MVTRRASESQWGQSLPWFAAAVLVLMGSGLIATWLNNTASAADSDALNRGADALESAVEEQVRILELAGTGTASLLGQPLDEIDIAAMVSKIDVTVLRSLLAVVTYPVGPEMVGSGDFVSLGLEENLDFPIPEIDATRADIEEVMETGVAFFSAPTTTEDPGRLDYVVAMPIESDDGLQLVGVVFRPDRMLATALEAAGESQYAVEVIDARYGDQVVATLGDPSSELVTRRSPDGLRGALELIVRPGDDFSFAASPYITPTVLGVGVVIALLLMWMGRMARARSRDLAERLRLAEEINESKDRFLATVSHELRTPLTVVMGVATEVGPRWEKYAEGERQELMKMMSEQAIEAANIVEDLLVAARSDPSRLRLALENTHLQPHVDYALASLPEDGRRQVVAVVPDRRVRADTTRLRQILRNLLENAVRYGGEVITVETSVDGSNLVTTVSDNGGNLAPEDLERIFEPYERSGDSAVESPTGIGIGLYISRLLARLMNGDLDCVCDGDHTRFRLTLPMAESDSTSQPDARQPALSS